MHFLFLPRGGPELEVRGVWEAVFSGERGGCYLFNQIKHKPCQGAHCQGKITVLSKIPEGRVHVGLDWLEVFIALSQVAGLQ